MSLTQSGNIEPKTKMPEFKLLDTTSGDIIDSKIYCDQKPTLIAFICNHCPYVKHIIARLSEIVNDYRTRGISCVLISSNDIEQHADDSPLKMPIFAEQYNLQCPYCYDETQTVAKEFKAACTPEFYLFDKAHELFYHGRFDASTPGNDIIVTGEDLCTALDNVLDNKPSPCTQMPSIGCNIKWVE